MQLQNSKLINARCILIFSIRASITGRHGRGRRVCAGQCRNKKFESQLTSNILSPIPGNNGPFDCARLVLALSSRGCCTLLFLPLVPVSFFLFSPFLFFSFSSPFVFDFYDPRFRNPARNRGSRLSRDVVWKGWSRRLDIFVFILYKFIRTFLSFSSLVSHLS